MSFYGRVLLDVTPVFKVGDPCPAGYIARQEWAEVHMKAGLKQEECGHCCRWQFPHELSSRIIEMRAFTSRRKLVIVKSRICIACDKSPTPLGVPEPKKATE